MPLAGVVVLIVLGLALTGLILLTAVGARRRGATTPRAVLSGVFFPAAWVVWYVEDEGR